MAEKLLSLKELCDWLEVSASTVYNWRVRGDGPRGYRVGRSLRFKASEVEQWLEQRADPASAA